MVYFECLESFDAYDVCYTNPCVPKFIRGRVYEADFIDHDDSSYALFVDKAGWVVGGALSCVREISEAEFCRRTDEKYLKAA